MVYPKSIYNWMLTDSGYLHDLKRKPPQTMATELPLADRDLQFYICCDRRGKGLDRGIYR